MATNEDETIKLDSTDSEPKKDGHEEDQEKKAIKKFYWILPNRTL
jgi:hypothetical protein